MARQETKEEETVKENQELLNNIQLYSLDEIAPHLEINIKTSHLLPSNGKIKVSLIKEGCKVCDIPFLGGGIIFLNKKPTINEELNDLKIKLSNMTYKGFEYIFAYAKEDRNHPNFSYYSIIGIKSDNMVDLKKAFRIQKLKAFL